MLIEPHHPQLSIVRQCELIGLNRSSYYHSPCAVESEENLSYIRLIDEQYLRTPFYGSRQMTRYLAEQGYVVNRKRVQRLMRTMGLQATVPGPHTSLAHPAHKVYPYLLRNVTASYPNHIWGIDITYIRLAGSWLYLVAIMDGYSRYVISWQLDDSLALPFVLRAMDEALAQATPVICNSDQGSQFTHASFLQRLLDAGACISMDGRGRALDNIFTERLWRSLKYEEVYLHDYETLRQARSGIAAYFTFYNLEATVPVT